MRLRNLGITTTILILLVLSFSSCESDRYRWVGGVLDKPVTFYSNKDGVIWDAFTINEGNIYINSGRYGQFHDIEIMGNDQIRLNVSSNYMFDDLWLDIEGTNAEIYFPDVRGKNSFYGGDVARFMDVIADQMRRYGYVTINVEAVSLDRRRDIRLDIQVYADVDVYIRD